MKKKAPFVSHEKEQIREFRKNPELAIEYLNSAIQVAFEENDPELILTALATVARSYGMTHVAKKAELKRESLHRMLSRRGNPEWASLFRVFKALQLRPRIERSETTSFVGTGASGGKHHRLSERTEELLFEDRRKAR